MITAYQELLDWQKRASRQKQRRVVLDLEADSLHRYRERLCLIQYADEQGVEIIDPLALNEEMQPFCEWLTGAEVWMHGADYDMSLLMGAYGVLPKLILDTQVAARLLGHEQFGLAALVEHYFGITLSKKKSEGRLGTPPHLAGHGTLRSGRRHLHVGHGGSHGRGTAQTRSLRLVS